MKHNLLYHTLRRKLQPSDEAGVVAGGPVEVPEDVVEAAAAEIVAEPTMEVALKAGVPNHAIRGPSTLTFQLVSGAAARCTSAGGKGHFSVPNQRPVPGRMSSLQNLQNETTASSVTLIIKETRL